MLSKRMIFAVKAYAKLCVEVVGVEAAAKELTPTEHVAIFVEQLQRRRWVSDMDNILDNYNEAEQIIACALGLNG